LIEEIVVREQEKWATSEAITIWQGESKDFGQ
jgi:hypothetical protein